MILPSPQEADHSSVDDRARDGLLASLRPLQERADSLRSQLAQVEFEQAPLMAAIAAYDEERQKQAKSPPRGKSPMNARKPCAKKADVEAVCVALLGDNGSLTQVDLEALAKEKLSREQGFNLSGFGLRFKECLASAAFRVSAEGRVTLAEPTSSPDSRKPVDKRASGAIQD